MATITPIAYNNTGTPIPGTTQIGNLAVGETRQDYGAFPSGKRFWATPNEDTSYVIAYQFPAGNHPNPVGEPCYVGFYKTSLKTDASFLSLANFVARKNGTPQNFVSTDTAKTWLNTNGYWTSYGNLVIGGLTLQLDASNTDSYPGSGNVWYDLTTPQENITLYNSPSYALTSPSYFTFNGSNQYGVGTEPVLSATTYTKSLWFYLNSYQDNNLISSNTGGHFMYMGAATNRIYCGHSNWPNYDAFPSNTTFDLNTWYNVTLTFNTTDGMKLYVNGVLDSTYTANKSPLPGDGSTNIATFAPNGNLLNGRIARVYCYNLSLSDSEVYSNYIAESNLFPSSPSPTPTPTTTQTPTNTPSNTASVTPSITTSNTPTKHIRLLRQILLRQQSHQLQVRHQCQLSNHSLR